MPSLKTNEQKPHAEANAFWIQINCTRELVYVPLEKAHAPS